MSPTAERGTSALRAAGIPTPAQRASSIRNLLAGRGFSTEAALGGEHDGDGHGGERTGRRQCSQGCPEEALELQTTLGGATAWIKRSKTSGEFMAVKKPAKKKAGREKIQGRSAREEGWIASLAGQF